MFRKLVFAQVLLGIIAFCMAEPGGNPGLLLVAGSLGALSWYVVEGPNGRPLPQWVIHLAAIAAVLWLVFDLRTQSDDVVVLAMGHFTMWLQVIQLYGRKSNREYGLLLVLSLLQVVGASMISASMVFGLLLIGYCVLALFTVLMFQLKITSDHVQQQNESAAPRRARVPRPKAVVGRGHRWHFRATAMFVGSVCAVVASVVFIMLPRGTGAATPLGGRLAQQTQVGFNTMVRLDSAPQQGNPTPVMNVSVRRGNQPVGAGESWLLRGIALDRYSPVTHTWTRSEQFVGTLDQTMINLDDGGHTFVPIPDGPDVTDFTIAFRNGGQQRLFTVFPFSEISSARVGDVQFNPLDQQVMLPVPSSGPIVYRLRHGPSVWAPALQQAYLDTSQTSIPRTLAWRYAQGWPAPAAGLLRERAQTIMKRARLARDLEAVNTPDDARIVAALADDLRNNYRYSLDNPPTQPGRDAIVEFLFNRRSGHCELFAAGLAAMSRSVGIRARVVAGYRIAEYNPIGDYYIVRQDDAHAWTEVHLGERGWVAFDATPPGEVEAEHAVQRGLFSPLRDLYEHLEFTWLSSVVSFDKEHREQLMSGLSNRVSDAASDRGHWLGAIVDWFKRFPDQWRRFRLNYTLMFVAIVFIVVGVVSLVHTLIQRRRRLAMLQLTRLPRRERRSLARRLFFYLRMLELLERRGHVRPVWQSPAQFAHELAARDVETFDPVVTLTEAFYEIRFGHREVDEPRRATIRDGLRRLEQRLSSQAMAKRRTGTDT